MAKARPLRPTVVLPDTTPLILLAAADALHVLTDLGPVVVVDIVALEATYYADKPFAAQIAEWIEAGRGSGSNAPIVLAETEVGPLYRLALDQGLKKPRNLGELAMTEWLVDNLDRIGGPALVVYEDAKVPALLARQGMLDDVAAATTRNVLTLAEAVGSIASAADLWTRIVTAIPTANPSSVFTLIDKRDPP